MNEVIYISPVNSVPKTNLLKMKASSVFRGKLRYVLTRAISLEINYKNLRDYDIHSCIKNTVQNNAFSLDS